MQLPTPTNLAGAILSIDLAALKANYKRLAKQAGKADCGAAVKGEAYGLGLGPVVKALWAAGCRTFFVARPMEGADVRAVLPNAVIYVLDGLHPGAADFYASHDLRPALISPTEVLEWHSFGADFGRALPCALHVDTGINRLGLSAQQFIDIVDNATLMSGLNIVMLMSHLACSDDKSHPMNQKQAQRFAEIRKKLPKVTASLANSSGIFLGKDFTHDLVRPGVALYGGNPTPHKKNPMQPVITLEGIVLQIRDVKMGETVGYSATWKAPRDSRIAFLGAGYRDGIPRMLSSRKKGEQAQAFIAGKRCPVVGRVSMDMMGIDVTDLPKSKVRRGMRAQIFGPKIPLDEAAGWAGTISYEVLTRLGSRYARVYSGADS